MRLKLFEEYNEYYSEIKGNDFFDTRKNKTTQLTLKERETILSFFPKKVDFTYGSKKDINILIDKSYNVNIFKTKDEWYYVSFFIIDFVTRKYEHFYFRCDQWGGMLKWLEDYKDEFKY